MRMPGFQDERIKILHDAMKWKAPKTYADLKKEGMLWEVLVGREREMMQAWRVELERVEIWKREHRYLERQGRGLEFIQKLNRLLSTLAEQTLATFTEFADMPEDDEDDVGEYDDLADDDVEDASEWVPASEDEPEFKPIYKVTRYKERDGLILYRVLRSTPEGSWEVYDPAKEPEP